MRMTRSRLLITLVLFGVLSAAAANAQVRLGYMPVDPTSRGEEPSAVPNAGEPDIGQAGPTRLSSTRATSGRTATVAGSAQSRLVAHSLARDLRVAWVIWMARYLSPTP